MTQQTPILVVDDDRDIREVVVALLTDEGYRLLSEAHDGLEALLMLQLSPEPMVALCDYRMPRLDGMRLVRAVTTDGPALRRHAIVLMTANASRLSVLQRLFLRRHAVALVRKPFDLDLLLRAVAAAVARVRQQQPAAVAAHAVGARTLP